jgi:hypothetical protein
VTGPAQFKPLDESLLDHELGRDIGYEYARFAMNLPDEAPAVFMEGFKHGQHSAKHKSSDAYDRKVLRLRYSAWRRNRYFDLAVDAEFLKSIDTDVCPILQIPMTRGTRQDTDASVDRIVNDAAYTRGNLMYMSVRANAAKGVKTFDDMVEIAATGETVQGLDEAAWGRLMYLAFACEVVVNPAGRPDPGMPCFLILPQHVQMSNKVCGLQQLFFHAVAASVRGRGSLYEAIASSCPSKKSKVLFNDLCRIFWQLLATELRALNKRGLTSSDVAQIAPNIWQLPGVFELWVKWFKSLKGIDLYNSPVVKKGMLVVHKSHIGDSWKLESGGYAEVNNF